MGNPITELNNYSDKIFQLLSNLEILDGQDPEGNEVLTDEEDFNEEQEQDDYGDEQDFVAEGITKGGKDIDEELESEDDVSKEDEELIESGEERIDGSGSSNRASSEEEEE